MSLESTTLELYSDQEVINGVQELFGYEAFTTGMCNFLPKALSEYILANKDKVQSSYDFQKILIHPFLTFVKQASINSLQSSGLDVLNIQDSHLFISNHRDIGLDSAFLNMMLFDNGFQTSQIAIGDNLMKHRIAELIFRINKSFAVKRSGGPRELYKSSIDLSNYIYQTIAKKIDSVWIAQREGRAKDGNDETQIGLLKMLGLSNKDSLKDHLISLNIVPVAMSYEYDPCDYLKTKEYIDKSKNPDYKKSFEDDMHSILQGIKGSKGNVSVAFGIPIKEQLKTLPDNIKPKELLQKMANIIDAQIYQLYKMNPINYIAKDLLNDSAQPGPNYSQKELDLTLTYLNSRIDKFDLVDHPIAKKYLYGIYANPLENQLNLGLK